MRYQPLIQIVEAVFGKDITEIIQSKIEIIKKTAFLRTVFAGQNILIDYNWSVKVIPGSSHIQKADAHLVSIEFLILDKNGHQVRKISEFSQEEFTKFCHQLNSVLT